MKAEMQFNDMLDSCVMDPKLNVVLKVRQMLTFYAI